MACLAGKLEMLSEKTDVHNGYVVSVAFSPDGTKIVSAGGETIKVWDSGALLPSNRPSLATIDTCWLVWQARWGC